MKEVKNLIFVKPQARCSAMKEVRTFDEWVLDIKKSDVSRIKIWHKEGVLPAHAERLECIRNAVMDRLTEILGLLKEVELQKGKSVDLQESNIWSDDIMIATIYTNFSELLEKLFQTKQEELTKIGRRLPAVLQQTPERRREKIIEDAKGKIRSLLECEDLGIVNGLLSIAHTQFIGWAARAYESYEDIGHHQIFLRGKKSSLTIQFPSH